MEDSNHRLEVMNVSVYAASSCGTKKVWKKPENFLGKVNGRIPTCGGTANSGGVKFKMHKELRREQNLRVVGREAQGVPQDAASRKRLAERRC